MLTISKSDPKSAVCAVKQPPEKTLQPESGSGKNSAVCLQHASGCANVSIQLINIQWNDQHNLIQLGQRCVQQTK